MEPERLIDEITELVFRQLVGNGRAVAAAPSPITREASGVVSITAPVPPPPLLLSSSRPQLLLVMGDGERGLDALWPQARAAAATARVVVVPSASFSQARLAAMWAEGGAQGLQILEGPPARWDELVRDSRAVVVPNAGLNALSGISMLFAMEPCVAAVLRGLIEGRPVLVGSDEIEFLIMHAAHLARPFVQGVRSHASTVQSMGVRLLDARSLGGELTRLAQGDVALAAPQGRGRSVLTRDDLETLARSGQRMVEVAMGTIVTPLARDEAARMGIEIVIR